LYKKSVDLLFIKWGKSFMYRRNSRGPRMEHCGIPYLINAQLEKAPWCVLYITALWYLPLR